MMRKSLCRWMICLGIAGVFCSASLARVEMSPLDDQQLSEVCAAGFDIKIDFDIDLAAKDPNSLIIQTGQLDALKELANQQFKNATFAGARNTGFFDENGNLLSNFGNITNNTLNITDNAMQNAKTLLNIIALDGDVAVGMNLNIIVNPGNTPFTITQTNINWSQLSALDTTPTLDTTKFR